MPQMQLPIFPPHSTLITNELAFLERDGMVWYFNGSLPVLSHAVDDLASFRLHTSQFIANGLASQGQISRAFGIPLVSVKRACRTLREKGPQGFFVPPARKKGHKLTLEKLVQVQELLDAGWDVSRIAPKVGVLGNTIHKAIRAGRVSKKKSLIKEGVSPKSVQTTT
jgi:transposase-like protein